MSDLTKLERRLHCYQVVLWLKNAFRRSSIGDTVEQRGRGASGHQLQAKTSLNELQACPPRHGNDDEELDSNVSLPKSAVYRAYLNMCRAHGLKPQLKPPALGKMVRNAFPGVMTKRRGPRGRVVQFYIGLEPIEDQLQAETSPPRCDEISVHSEQVKTSEEEHRETGWSGSGEWPAVCGEWEISDSAAQAEHPRSQCDITQRWELWSDFPAMACTEITSIKSEPARSSFVVPSQSPLSSPEREGAKHQPHRQFASLDSILPSVTAIKLEPYGDQEEQPWARDQVEGLSTDQPYIIDEAMLGQLEVQEDTSFSDGCQYFPSSGEWARLIISSISLPQSTIVTR